MTLLFCLRIREAGDPYSISLALVLILSAANRRLVTDLSFPGLSSKLSFPEFALARNMK